MAISPMYKLRALTVAKFTIAGALIVWFISVINDPDKNYFYYLANGLLIGLMLGIVETLLDAKFKKMSFASALALRTIIYTVMFFLSGYLMMKLVLWMSDWSMQRFYTEDEYATRFFTEYFNREYGGGLNLFFVLPICLSVSFARQINALLGRGTVWKYFTGRYHRPKAEERIFMFLDLNSATTIAEKLGALTYSKFLRDFFFDLGDEAIATKGEIVQYVGDEVVVTWTLANGALHNNCVAFFFRAQDRIEQRRSEYIAKYGIVPEFKAGLHLGTVVVTEVGKYKKEIAYHGDPMNTTARICSTCHAAGKKLLVSVDLLEHLNLEGSYAVKPLGEFELKGKEFPVELVGLMKT